MAYLSKRGDGTTGRARKRPAPGGDAVLPRQRSAGQNAQVRGNSASVS